MISVDENSLSSLNGLSVRILMEVNLRFPLKRVLVIKDDGNPTLLSCEKLFEVCFYCGRIRMALQIRIRMATY